MKKFELSIPKPCHENWDAMTPEDKGRFCGACQRTVVDFSTMTDRQIADFFKKPANSVCGRFRNEQLGREIDVPKKRLPWIKCFFTISLPALLVSTKAASQGEVRLKGRVAVCTKPVAEDSAPQQTQKIVEGRTITGKVVDENDQPIQHASVYLEGTSVGTTTDSAGNFKLACAAALNARVNISYVGHTPITTTINKLATKEPVRLTLTPATMGEVVVTTGFVVRKQPAIVPLIQPKNGNTAFSEFAVYPNPVLSKSILVIDVKKLEAGEYNLQLITSAGELLKARNIVIANKQKRFTYELKSTSAGTYFIRLTNKKNNKSYTETIVVH